MAYHLLRTSIPPSPAEIERFDNIMRHVQLSEGVYRTTECGRFETLDAFLLPILQAQFHPGSSGSTAPLLAEDWAASACITSVEWYEKLEKSFPPVRMTASDMHLYLVEILLSDGASYIVESEGPPLQYIKPPFVIPLNRPEPSVFPVNCWLQAKARRQFETLKTQGILESVRKRGDREEWEQDSMVFRRIPLVHPKALALERASPAFKIEQHSVFEVRPELCHVIRTMNILNLSYFDKEQLMAGVRTVWQSLEENGVWMVGRTIKERSGQVPALHHASVFRKTPAGFQLLDRHHAASEIEDLGLALRV
jgi:hypothetical protein